MLFVITILSGVAGFLMFGKKAKNYSKLLHFSFVLSFVIGASTWLLNEVFFDIDEVKSAALCTVLGIILVSCFMRLIRLTVRCKQPVQAKYDGCITHSGYRGVASSVPKFCYEWQGMQYQEESPQVESKRLLKKLVPGESYTIYIDPHDPRVCIANRRVRVSGFVVLLVGLFYLACGVSLASVACKLVWMSL